VGIGPKDSTKPSALRAMFKHGCSWYRGGVQEVTDGGEGKIGPSMDYTFTAELWQYDGESPWSFITSW
jgi:hypothetical protein